MAEDEGWVEEEEEVIDEREVAIDEVLEEFIPKILAETIEILNNERDAEVLQELQQSLKATEVSTIKESLREADTFNLTKTDQADALRAWLAEIQSEIAIFDLIREQRKITTELEGSTQLLKLIGKAYDENLKHKPKKLKSTRELLSRGQPDLDNSNLALRMGGQDASQHFALEAYEQDEEDESQFDMQYNDEAMQTFDEDEESEESEESEQDYAEIEALFWDQLDDSDEEDEEGGPRQIDVLGMWRMRVPRHIRLLKDCVIHLGKCTQRLDATADKKEIASLFKRLRYLCTAGDRRSMVELIVMTEIIHLPLEDPSLGNQRTALHYAAANGCMAAVKRLLKCGARVHAMDKEGNTPLHLAAANNQGAICQVLMYHGAGTARQRLDGSNSLHVAALAGSTDACLAMLSLGEKAESIKSAPKKKGAIEVDSDAPECVGINVRRGVEGNTSENTPLLCAAMGVSGTATSVYGWPSKREDVSLSSGTIFHVDTVRLLLLWGADVNIAGERGITLLHLVTTTSALFPVFREIVDEHMYALGLDVPCLMALQPPEPDPKMTAEVAVEEKDSKKNKKKDKSKEQAKGGKKKKKSNKVEPTPPAEEPKNKALKAAARAVIAVNVMEELEAKRKELLFRMRWKRMLNVNGLNGDGNTALHVALYNNNRDAAMVLLLGFHCTCDLNSYKNDMRRVKNPLEEPPECCCLSPPLNVNKANDYGLTPLHIAARHHDLDLIKHLLNRGANKNRLAMLSGGPLHLAVTVGGCVDIVNLLIKSGADLHLRNNQHGRTPLHILCTDTARPWDDSNGCLRPLQPLLMAVLNASDHAMDKDRQGRTPLALAVISKRILTVQLLLDHRRAEGSEDTAGITVKVGQRTSDVRKPDKEGRTPLHHACIIAKLELLECVLNGNDAVVLDAASKVRYEALTKKIEAAKEKKKNEAKGNKVEDEPEKKTEEAEAAVDVVAESLTSRGALYAQDIKGNTIFHIAAEMPRTKPEAAVEIMEELMNRITAQPPGVTAWSQVMEDDDDETEFVEPEDGYEEWPATFESEQTAWHRIVSHTLSTGEATSSMAELQPGEVRPPSVTEVALQVLKVMLGATTYAPKDKKAKRRKLDAVDIDGETCLQNALRLNNLQYARCLLEAHETHDFGLNARTIKHGRTALITAADMGLFDVVQKLIALGSRVNESDRKGFTPLMAACRLGVGGRLDGLSFQARLRIAEDTASGDGSVSGDQLEVDAEEEATKAALVDLLLNSEADPNRINDDADTALHFICEQASSPVQSLIVTRLITAGSDPSKVNKRKDTPLHLAIENLDDGSAKSKTILLALLDAKADYTVKNRKRRTPHELAVYLKKNTLAGIVAKYDEFAVKLDTKKKKRR